MEIAIEGGKTKFSHDYDTETFSPDVCRSANRSSSLPGYRNYSVGFRLSFSPGH